MVSVFNTSPVRARQVDPFFGGARLRRLAGEVVALFVGFLADFDLGAFADDLHECVTGPEACGHGISFPQNHGSFFESSVSFGGLGKRGEPPVLA